jgi:predicted small lipoprotein YifL
MLRSRPVPPISMGCPAAKETPTMRPAAAVLALLLPIAACGGPVPLHASLPPDATVGAGDPTRAAIVSSAYAFNTPASLAGRPVEAARAAAQLEHLATEIPYGPRWAEFSPLVGRELVAARGELRSALGIAPEAPPQAVVDALYAASRALAAGDAAAAERVLPPPAFRSGRATLARLSSLPPLPRTGTATALTDRELLRMDQTSRADGGDGGRD